MREIEIEKPACEYAEATGWFQCKMVSPGLRGMPDRFFARNAVLMFIEFKAPGEVATKQQERRHRELREHGVIVWVCDNLELAYALLA